MSATSLLPHKLQTNKKWREQLVRKEAYIIFRQRERERAKEDFEQAVADVVRAFEPVDPSHPKWFQVIARAEQAVYARRADRVVVRHGRGRVVAVVEIVSPGNKSNRHTIRAFVEKAGEMLRQGVNLLVVDLFPPTSRDPQGIHKAIWDEFGDEPFESLCADLLHRLGVAYQFAECSTVPKLSAQDLVFAAGFR